MLLNSIKDKTLLFSKPHVTSSISWPFDCYSIPDTDNNYPITMSASSSPFRPSNTPVYIDDSLSPVKLPTRSPMKPPPPFSLPNKSSQQGTPPVKETTNTSPSKPAQHNILKPPYTEKLNKTTFLNISSAQRRSTIGNPGRSYSSGERRMLNLRSSSSLNKPSPNTVSTTSPLHKRRKPANLNSIQNQLGRLGVHGPIE